MDPFRWLPKLLHGLDANLGKKACHAYYVTGFYFIQN